MRFFAIASLVFAAGATVLASPVVERENTPLMVTLENLQSNLAVPVQNLHSLVATNNVNVDTVKPHTDAICAAFSTAIEAVKAIEADNSPLSSILGIVTGILTTVLGVVASVLAVGVALVGPLLAAVVKLAGELIAVVVGLVGGLAATLVSIVGNLLTPLTSLGQNTAFSAVIGN